MFTRLLIMSKNALILLVDGARGIHGPVCLAAIYNLYIECSDPLTKDVLKYKNDRTMIPFNQYLDSCGETMASFFYNSFDVGHFEQDCAVLIDGCLHDIVFIEGDIFAVHPQAEWDDEKEQYTFPSKQDIN